jgi:predicted enzyme related to lactoylglutathione lyase
MEERFKQHGAFSWSELLTPDLESAKAFYTRLFGWTLEDMPMEGMTYTVIKAGEREVGGMMTTPPDAQGMPPAWGSYVTVDDVDRVAGTAADLGATIVVAPRDIPGVGRLCVIRDPQGAIISAITYAACD